MSNSDGPIQTTPAAASPIPSSNAGAELLWIDLEMTGLEPEADRITEVAAIVTTFDLVELGEFTAGVRVDEAILADRMGPGREFWDAHPETRDALIELSRNAPGDAAAVEADLAAFIDAHFPRRDGFRGAVLAGNSIHQDRRFIVAEWPAVDARLHYRMLDVSSWKIVLEGKFGVRHTKQGAHRALDDIRESIAELRYYQGFLDVERLAASAPSA